MTLVFAIGSPDGGDDAAGPAVAARLRDRRLPFLRVEDVADPVRLLDAWATDDDVVVVDAVRCDDEPAGTVLTIDAVHLAGTPAAPGGARGTHGLGLPDVVRLARATDALPARLVVVGVVGRSFEPGTGLSGPVRACLDAAADAVVAASSGAGGDATASEADGRPTSVTTV